MSSEDGTPHAAHAQLVLGVSPDASRAQLQAAYWRLRAHVEERARTTTDADFALRRDEEVEALTRALREALGGVPLAPTRRPRAARRARPPSPARTRGLLIWAIAATFSTLVLAGLLLLRETPAASPQVESTDAHPAAPARLAVRAEPPGARLEVLATGDQRVVATGLADGSSHALEAGAYLVRVDREDCPDEWRHEVVLAAGEEVSFAPRICEGEGGVVVRSNVSSDRLRIDGRDAGSTGPETHRVPVGDHELSVEKEGFETWTGTVRVRPGQDLTLHAELAPSAGSGPPATARSSPPAPARPPASPPDASAPASPERAAAGGTPIPAPPLAEDPLRVAYGGSKRWHDEVRQRLLEKYDANGSRQLDNPEEVNAIPCDEWRSIQSSYQTGGLSVPMTRLYGFDGSEWVPGALGVAREMRGYAYDRMHQCGLP